MKPTPVKPRQQRTLAGQKSSGAAPPEQLDTPPPSCCAECQHPLSYLDLVPLANLRRKRDCATCNRRTRSATLTVGVATVAAWGATVYQYGFSAGGAVLAGYFVLLIYLAVVDLKLTLLPNAVVLPAIPLALALFPLTPPGETSGIAAAYVHALSGAGAGFAIMLALYLVAGGRLGGGDVKLAALLGAMLGFPQIIGSLLVGFIAGGVIAIGLVMLKLKGRRDIIPYGPVLIASAILVLLAGSGVYDWYLDLLTLSS